MWKPLLAAAGGAAVGFLFAKMRYEKEAYAYANERIEQAKVYAEERADRRIETFLAEADAETEKAKVDAVAEAFTKAFEEEDAQVEEVFTHPEVDKLLTNYAGFSTPQPPTVVEEDSESHIVLIRRKEFFEGPLNDKYHQVATTYYQNDDILIDERDKQLDVQAAIGNIRPNWFGNEADDENVCYVRNTKLEIEFEVNRALGSYAKDVLGLGEGEGEG
ncbi:hypothetical protein SEA_CLUBPENGUIN_61 [Streptomyces phage ClubPenguin]|nr:hypothetical protein SEA_CLUBPENGUIN_61 [Streptomyces phage ClubPenguin]